MNLSYQINRIELGNEAFNNVNIDYLINMVADKETCPSLVARNDNNEMIAVYTCYGWQCNDWEMEKILTFGEFMNICKKNADYIILGEAIAKTYENLMRWGKFHRPQIKFSLDVDNYKEFQIFLLDNFIEGHKIYSIVEFV